VSQIEIRLSAILGHEHFAVLKRAHGPGINVQIWIALLKSDFETATFEETTD